MNCVALQPPYPALAFPPLARATINEIHDNTQAPLALVAGCALATMSLAAQNVVDVRRLNGLVSGCSVYMLAICDSGDRKTSVERHFTSPIFAFQAEMDAEHKKALHDLKSARSVWEVEKKLLERMLIKATLKVEPVDDIRLRSIKHAKMEPIEPRRIKVIYNDVTPSALLHAMYVNSQSAGLIDDEAGRIISGPMVHDLPLLNKLWDGNEVQVDRRSTESFSLRQARLTVSLLVQNGPFAKFLEKKGDEARGIGFLARCLISQPMSTQGTRFIRAGESNLESLPKFHDRVTQLLRQNKSNIAHECAHRRIELHFSPEAQPEWVAVYNKIEHNINPGGVFCDNRDYASKVAENIARVAAIFHCFEGYEGTSISLETLKSATTVVLWYAEEFVRMFSPQDPLHETIKDADELQDWMIRLYRLRNISVFDKNLILQRGPNKLRSKERLAWALECLTVAGRIFLLLQGKKKLVQLNLEYFGPAAQGLQPQGFLPLSLTPKPLVTSWPAYGVAVFGPAAQGLQFQGGFR